MRESECMHRFVHVCVCIGGRCVYVRTHVCVWGGGEYVCVFSFSLLLSLYFVLVYFVSVCK